MKADRVNEFSGQIRRTLCNTHSHTHTFTPLTVHFICQNGNAIELVKSTCYIFSTPHKKSLIRQNRSKFKISQSHHRAATRKFGRVIIDSRAANIATK